MTDLNMSLKNPKILFLNIFYVYMWGVHTSSASFHSPLPWRHSNKYMFVKWLIVLVNVNILGSISPTLRVHSNSVGLWSRAQVTLRGSPELVLPSAADAQLSLTTELTHWGARCVLLPLNTALIVHPPQHRVRSGPHSVGFGSENPERLKSELISKS